MTAVRDRLLRGKSVPGQRVVQGGVQVQFANGVAVLIGLGPVDPFAAEARRHFFVPFALASAQVGEDFHQRLALHFGDGPRRQAELALAVFVEHAILEQLLEHFGLGLVLWVLHHLLDRLQCLLAILHDELHELIEAEQLS